MSIQNTNATLPYAYTKFSKDVRYIELSNSIVEEIIFMIGPVKSYVCRPCSFEANPPRFSCRHSHMECNEMAMKITTFALAVYRKTEKFPLVVRGAIHAFIQPQIFNSNDPHEVIIHQSIDGLLNIPRLSCENREEFTQQIITLASRDPENAGRMVAKILSLLEQRPNAYICPPCALENSQSFYQMPYTDCSHCTNECDGIAMTMCYFALDTFKKTENIPLFVKTAICSFHSDPESMRAFDLEPEEIVLQNSMTLTFAQKYNELMMRQMENEELRMKALGLTSLNNQQLQEKEWNRDLTAEDEEADRVEQWGGYVNQLQRPMLQTSNRSTRELNLLSVAMRRNYEAPSIDIEPVTSTVFYGTVNSPSQPAGGMIVTPTSGESTISGNAPAL